MKRIKEWLSALSNGGKVLAGSVLIAGSMFTAGLATSPVIEEKIETDRVPISFQTVTEKDNTMFNDESEVIQEGVNGEKEVTYTVTYTNGEESKRIENSERMLIEPIDEIVRVGTLRKEKVEETENISFSSKSEYDSSMDEGESYIKQEGVDGIKTLVYEVVFDGAKEVDRKLNSETITKNPQDKIVVYGTRVVQVASNCDPNYTGCVPIAYDVDCAGGSGNGPAYASGPVQVIGSDIYGLDRDNDGWGCE